MSANEGFGRHDRLRHFLLRQAMAEAVINGKVQPKRTKAMDMSSG
jgi:hypothetical protein